MNRPVKMLSVPSVPEDGAWSCRSGLTLNRPDRAVIPGLSACPGRAVRDARDRTGWC